MKLVSKEIAEQELSTWLSLRGTSPRKLDECKKSGPDGELSWFDETVELIEYGTISFSNEGKTLVQSLDVPTADARSLEYKQRLTQEEFLEKAKGVAKGDTSGINIAYICALTGSASNLIRRLDWEDLKTARHIASFFA